MNTCLPLRQLSELAPSENVTRRSDVVTEALEDRFVSRRVLQLLHDAGLCARIVTNRPLRLVGGTSRTNIDGIDFYENGFTIWLEPDESYWAGMTGRGNVAETFGPGSLGGAIRFVQESCERRKAGSR